MSAIREQEKSQDRVARVPFGGPQLNLQLSPVDRQGFVDRGMVPRWFNDQHGRVERATAAGYTFVKQAQVPGLGQNLDVGEKVKKVVSKGDKVIYAILMETTQEFYAEDQASKEKTNALVDEALALGGKNVSDLENEYKPT